MTLRKRTIIKCIFSVLFGIVMMLDRQITVNIIPDLFTRYDENYIGPMTVESILMFVVSAAALFVLLTGAEKLAAPGPRWVLRENVRPLKKRWFWIFAAVMALCWLPWLLSNIPGGIFPDTYWVYDMIAGRIPLDNHQPILYTGLNALVFFITQNILPGTAQESVLTMTVLQLVFMALALSSFVCWLLKRGFSRIVAGVVLAYFAVFPLFSYYASSNWKDTWFSIFVFLFSVFMVDVVRTKAANLLTKEGVTQFFWLAFFVCWFRNNGIYIVAFTAIWLLIRYRRTLLIPFFKRGESDGLNGGGQTALLAKPGAGRAPAFLIAAVSLIVATGVAQGPVFDRIGFNRDQAIESYSIPIQQICSVIANGGAVTEEEHAVFDRIIKPKIIEVYFSPNGVDPVKQYMTDEAKAYLSDNQPEFFKTWASIVAKNPEQAAEAYLITTLGFWDPARGAPHGYMIQGLAPGGNWYGLTPRDLIYENTGFSFNALFAPRHYISAALFCWIALFCFVVLILRRKYALLVPFIPMLALWGTVLLTTPISFSLRYVFAFVPFMPLAVLLMLGAERFLECVNKEGQLSQTGRPGGLR